MSQVATDTKADYAPSPVVLGVPSIDRVMTAQMRCLCALSALLIFKIDPPQLAHIAVANLVLYGYCTYCVASCIALIGGRQILPLRAEPWADVLFYIFLVVLSGGTSSIFYHYFFFAILVAAFTRGAFEGRPRQTCVKRRVEKDQVEAGRRASGHPRHRVDGFDANRFRCQPVSALSQA